MSVKRGLPTNLTMRHDTHYVEEMSRGVVGKNVGRLLPIDKIEPNPEQPRVEIGDLTELTSSIKQKGVLEPLLVKPQNGSWMIIAGERRWRAANLAGLREVPCIELDIDDKNIAEIALIENLQRKDLTIWEEADGLAALVSKFEYTHDEVAKKIGKSRTTVTESIAIANLPDSVREKCREAKLNAKSTLLEISRQFDEKEMLKLVETLQNKGVTTRENVRKITRPLPKISTIVKEVKEESQKVEQQKIVTEPVKEIINKQPVSSNKFNNPAIKPNIVEANKPISNELASLINAPLHNASNRLSPTETRKNVFMYVSPNGDYSIELKFPKKQKYELSDVIEALNQTLNFWDKMSK